MTPQPLTIRPRLLRFVRPLLLFGLVPALLFALLYSPNLDGGIDLFHEGESLTPAFELSQGKLPFRDVYLQHGWGANVLRAQLAFFLFGESVGANRKLLYGVNGIIAPIIWIVVYLLLYSLFRNKLWIIPAFLLLALADVLLTDRHLLPLLSIALLAAGSNGRRIAWPLSGMLAGAAVFYSLDTGVYSLAIGLIFIASYSHGDSSYRFSDMSRMAARFLVGAALGAAPFLLYLLWHGILGEFLRNSFVQLRYQGEIWGIHPPAPASLLGPFENATVRNRTWYVFIKWYFPALIYILTALALLPRLRARSLSKEEAPILLVLITGIVFYPSALGRADEGHLMYAIAPFWILSVCLLARLFSSKNMPEPAKAPNAMGTMNPSRGRDGDCPKNYGGCILPRRFGTVPQSDNTGIQSRDIFTVSIALAIGAIILSFALYFWATCRNGGVIQNRFQLAKWKSAGMPGYVSLNIERAGGIKVPARQAEEIEGTVAFIAAHTRPDQPIFDFSNQGAYYFLAGRKNSTMFCQAAYAIPAPLQRTALQQLEHSPPAAVILSEEPRYAPYQRQPLIDEWIRQRYEVAAQIGRNIIFLPKAESKITAVQNNLKDGILTRRP